MTAAIEQVRVCLAAIRPDLDVAGISADTPLLEQRVIKSFEVLDLLLHLEHASGLPISRAQLVPGSFRDIRTIARVFIDGEALS